MMYRTSAGDVLDRICLAHYERVDVVPVVLDANPGLAAFGPVLPAGVLITLPEIDAADTISGAETIKLWD